MWDYNLYDDEDPAPCYCGSPKCRGTMYSRDWMAKMRRKEARRKKQQELTKTGKGTTSSRADSNPQLGAGFSL